MNSNESALENNTNRLNAYLQAGGTDGYVADILSTWDENEDYWVQGAPIILRTEGHDVTIWWPDEEHLRICLESIDVYADFTTREFLPDAALWNTMSHHVVWRQYRSLRSLIGYRMERVSVVEEDGRMKIRMHFAGGCSLLLSAGGSELFLSSSSLKSA